MKKKTGKINVIKTSIISKAFSVGSWVGGFLGNDKTLANCKKNVDDSNIKKIIGWWGWGNSAHWFRINVFTPSRFKSSCDCKNNKRFNWFQFIDGGGSFVSPSGSRVWFSDFFLQYLEQHILGFSALGYIWFKLTTLYESTAIYQSWFHQFSTSSLEFSADSRKLFRFLWIFHSFIPLDIVSSRWFVWKNDTRIILNSTLSENNRYIPIFSTRSTQFPRDSIDVSSHTFDCAHKLFPELKCVHDDVDAESC